MRHYQLVNSNKTKTKTTKGAYRKGCIQHAGGGVDSNRLTHPFVVVRQTDVALVVEPELAL